MDHVVMVIIKAFSTFSFAFKITSRPTATSSSSARVNPFKIMRESQSRYTSLPPRFCHARMYANHNGYHALLIDFLEENKLGWKGESTLSIGKRFVYGMSRAFFECNYSIWKALLIDVHNNSAYFSLFLRLHDFLFV